VTAAFADPSGVPVDALPPPERPPAAPPHLLRRPRLYLDARHGLGNRLRALASGAAIAQATGRELVVVWEPDAHCAARFADLFRTGLAVEEAAFPRLFALTGGRVWNYMDIEPGAARDAPVLDDEGPGTPAAAQDDVYVRSAYPLVSPHRSWEAERAFLHALRPVPDVEELVRSVEAPSQVAAHVRMASGPGYEHLPHESPAGWSASSHAELLAWRARSHARHFTARLDALTAGGTAGTIFLAADLPQTYEAFRDRYGARLRFLPRDCFDRSPRQQQHALADMLLLGRASRLLGSTWSSFTDMARRLAPAPLTVEMSGQDF
jgi:hypothetical protein